MTFAFMRVWLAAALVAPGLPAIAQPLPLAPLEAAAGLPPAPGTAAAADDLAVLRWLQRFRSPELVADAWLLLDRNPNLFSRALGVDMAKTTPAISRGLREFLAQVDAASSQIKDRVRRPRPYQSHGDLQPCLPPERGFSFPSGHATWYAAAAELLAALVPERSQRVLAVGTHGGASRVMCGVHYPSDVEAGLRLGRAAADQLRQGAQWQAFRDDPAVQAELQLLRQVPAASLPLLVH